MSDPNHNAFLQGYPIPKLRLSNFILSSVFAILLAFSGLAQDCSQIASNVLCTETAPTTDTLLPNPFSFGCFNAQLTYFYSFHTGTDPSGQVNIDIIPGDCDSFLGNDQIFVSVLELPTGVNPCNPVGSPFQGSCQGSTGQFTASYSGLAPDHDFLLMVGSDHDTTYGPCSFDIIISGPGVDVVASVDPFLIALGESADLNAGGANPGASYTWSPQSWLNDAYISNPTSTPEETTAYTVSTQVGSCDVTDIVVVTVGPPITIYNTFTPNGDGVNDTWVIPGIQRFENVEINVYDRWGQNVFRSIGYAQPWDGTNKGKYLPTGAYYYHIELNNLDVTIPPYTGEVSIIH